MPAAKAPTQMGRVGSHLEEDDNWVLLVTRHLTYKEQEELSSAESDAESEILDTETVGEESQTFLVLAFQKTA